MVEKESSWEIEVSFSNYYVDPFEENLGYQLRLDKANLHDAIPYALADNIRTNRELKDYLGIEKPNRVIGEDEDTKSWFDTEDWAISCSRTGEFVIGQTSTCYDKGDFDRRGVTEDLDMEELQLRSFEDRLKYIRAYKYLDGLFAVGVESDKKESSDLDQKISEAVRENGSYDLNVYMARLEVDDSRIWDPDYFAKSV